MVLSMMDSGMIIKCRVLGDLNMQIWIYMKENLKMELPVGRVSTHIAKVICMKDIGIIIGHTEEANISIHLAAYILVIIKMVTSMAMGSINGQMVQYIKVRLPIIISMGMVSINGPMVGSA